MKNLIRILFALILFLGGIFLCVACFFYHPADTSWNTASTYSVTNLTGKIGAFAADILMQFFGKMSYFIPVACVVFGFFMLRHKRWLSFRLIMFCGALGGACWLLGGSSVIQNLTIDDQWTKVEAGGFVGFYLRQWIPEPAVWVACIGWFVVGLLFILGLRVPFFLICRWSSRKMATGMAHVKAANISMPKISLPTHTDEVAAESDSDSDISEEMSEVECEEPQAETKPKKSFFSCFKKEKKAEPKERIEPTFETFGMASGMTDIHETPEEEVVPVVRKKSSRASAKKEKQIPVPLSDNNTDKDNLELPSIDLLGPVVKSNGTVLSKDKMEKISKDLEKVLSQYSVNGKVIGAQTGPVVTLYEFEPAPGIRTSRVISLADDIAMKMCVKSVRIAVIPGKNALGIEMPNPVREMVSIRELIENVKFQANNGTLPIILGKDIGGVPVFADLARMPHLLVAGTTGSGKSVGINTIIISLLYRFTPAECRFILVDPKMVELSVYNDIPHLLTPVVTEAPKAVLSLKWAVCEMEDRYRSMMYLGVRNIETYNQKVLEAKREGKNITRRVQTGFDAETGHPIFEEQNFDLTPFPYIVVIVDEFADLMQQCGKEIDPLIQRLAQKARAVGIHLILATQRPDSKTITGTIKANFPSRISFLLPKRLDSQIIIDEAGAEQLLGKGDMLYLATGQKPQRVHGPFVSDEMVHAVVDHWIRQSGPDYLDAVMVESDGGLSGGSSSGGMDSDMSESGDLYDRAVAIVLRDKKPTTSYVQRQLRIGYNKAADLIDRMESEGIVSKPNVAGKREILVPTDNA